MDILKMLIFILSISVILVENKNRQKRQLIYRDKSRVFLRMNIKDNVLPYNAIIAQTSGFKVTWDVPHKPYPHGSFFRKRDISNALEEFIISNGFSEYFCIFNYVCKYLSNDFDKCGFICEMTNYIFRHSKNEEKEAFLNKILLKCTEHSLKCDMPRLKFSSYTDLY